MAKEISNLKPLDKTRIKEISEITGQSVKTTSDMINRGAGMIEAHNGPEGITRRSTPQSVQ